MDFDVKNKVKEYYGGIATSVQKSPSSCGCGSSCCDEISGDLYEIEYLKELPKEAISASLGCANPLVMAELKEGETVLDLGSGGGIDVLISSRYVGETGKVYGLDMTEEMLALANQNKARMGTQNVEFMKGYIENIPLESNSVDVILSNCVINLSEDKPRALAEAFRVLKPGGRLAVADIISLREVPRELRKIAEMWAGCMAGTLHEKEYRLLLEEAGFEEIEMIPVHIYTKAVIEDMIQQKNISVSFDLEALDGAFAGAYIKAVKR